MDNHSLITEEHGSSAGNLILGGKIFRTSDRVIAIVPHHGYRSSRIPYSKLERNFGGRRISQAMLHRIIISHLRANRFRRIQIKRPEGRIDHMTKPIANSAGSEVQP